MTVQTASVDLANEGAANAGGADAMAENANPVTIDVISDVVCPWCFIGKRRLERALVTLHAREPETAFAVRWHPFQLNPELPHEGVDRRAYLEAKFGGPQRAAQIYARVAEAGRTVDIPFAFDAIARQPNTLDAHRLIAWAQQQGDADALVEGLFRAYFLEGRFIGDRDELARIAGETGYDAAQAQVFLASQELMESTAASERQGRAMGVSGVPFIIFGGKVAVSGAQEPALLLDALQQARNASSHQTAASTR